MNIKTFQLTTMLMLAVSQVHAAWYTLGPDTNDRLCHLMVSRYDPTSYMESFLRQETSPPPIEREEVELPDGSKKLTMRTVNKVGPIVVQFFEKLDACNEEIRTREIASGQRATPVRVGKGETYAHALRKRYGNRLQFANGRARSVVEAFNIDCRSRDGRYVPLVNILYAKLAAVDSPKAWQVTFVDSRGGKVRITDDVVTAEGKTIVSQVWGEINEWGELVLNGVRSEALLNTCGGSFGPIWAGGRNPTSQLVPSEPLVSEPDGFKEKAKRNPIWACAWKIAVAAQDSLPSADDLAEKDRYCNRLSAAALVKAKNEASQILHQ